MDIEGEMGKLRWEAQKSEYKIRKSYENAAPDYANAVKSIIENVEKQYSDLKNRFEMEPSNKDLERQIFEMKIAIYHWDWKLLNEVKNYILPERLGYTEEYYHSIMPSIRKLEKEYYSRFPVSDLRRDVIAEIRTPIYDKCSDIWNLLIEGTLHQKITWDDHILLCSIAENHWKNVDGFSDQLIDELLIKLKKFLNGQCFGLNAEQSVSKAIKKDETLARYLANVPISGNLQSKLVKSQTPSAGIGPTKERTLADALNEPNKNRRDLEEKCKVLVKYYLDKKSEFEKSSALNLSETLKIANSELPIEFVLINFMNKSLSDTLKKYEFHYLELKVHSIILENGFSLSEFGLKNSDFVDVKKQCDYIETCYIESSKNGLPSRVDKVKTAHSILSSTRSVIDFKISNILDNI